MPALSVTQVDERVASMTGWARDGDEIEREFTFADFAAAMAFVNKVALAAEAADHHPDIDIRYNRVKMALSTHSEGGVTEKDFALAAQIDAASEHRDNPRTQVMTARPARASSRWHGCAATRSGCCWPAWSWCFALPRLSPFEGLNEYLNVFQRFSEWLLRKLESLFADYGYWVVFLGVLLENSMFLGLLVPGSIILILAGLSAENGSINIWYVIALGIAATIIGDTISYVVGRLGLTRRLADGSLGGAMERAASRMESNHVWIILAYHWAGYSRVVGPAAAGLFRIPYRRWAPLDYAGAAFWVRAT